ncbi:MAG: formate dehydrogenase accessory protein FdhE [Desulfovibrionales bacterium]|nr:formate dehydrogenase accessory protein FdhE [Desulfovibrionales bacterium]
MDNGLSQIKERIALFREKMPVYRQVLDFYEGIREAQNEIKTTVDIPPVEIERKLKNNKFREGVSLLNKEDFQVDVLNARKVFESILQLGEKAPPKLREEMVKINQAVLQKDLDIEAVLSNHLDETFLQDTAYQLKIDSAVLSFLVRTGIEPSIKAYASAYLRNVRQFKEPIPIDIWSKGYCPICGSAPCMALFGKDGGKRYVLCSFCGHEWQIQRLICPFCGNNDHKTLRYFFADGNEDYRVDLCDQCHQYIKTVDSRNLDYEPVLALEDLVTLHLDILASQQGFQRPVSSVWAP